TYEPLKGLRVTSGLSYSVLLDKAEFDRQGVNTVARNLAKQGTLSWETELRAIDLLDRISIYANFAFLHAVRNLGEEGYRAQLIGSANSICPAVLAHAGLEASVFPWLR